MHRSILGAIGTPLVQVQSPPGSIVAAKVESFNPGGSSKDRPAVGMVEAAERDGQLTPGDRIVEATSGNTGIGLAMTAAAKGYDLTIVMPSSKSVERRRLLRAYGADIELVDGPMADAMMRASEIGERDGVVELGQFSNEANPSAHYQTTAAEIIDSVNGGRIVAFVAAVGTGGTITGVGRRLKEHDPDIAVVAVEPESNAVLATGESGEDRFQGMGPGFVSDITDPSIIDRFEAVGIQAAEAECRRLATEEGILVGQSSGAASIAARRVATDFAERDRKCPGPDPSDTSFSADGGAKNCPVVVTVFPDSGERYLTVGTFDGSDG